jgi:hypothetical protein
LADEKMDASWTGGPAVALRRVREQLPHEADQRVAGDHRQQTQTQKRLPKLKNGFYYYKDAKGHEQAVAQGRVLEIAPASYAEEEKKFTPNQPKEKHWYWPF